MFDDTAKNRGDKRIRFESDVSPKIMSVREKKQQSFFIGRKVFSIFQVEILMGLCYNHPWTKENEEITWNVGLF